MKVSIITLLIILPLTGLFSQDIIQGTYSYTYGDSESLVDARKTCKDLALREAIESYSVFIQSSTTVENFQLKSDLITSISGGNLKNVKILDQQEEGRTITMTVSAEVNPDEIRELIEKASTSSQKDEGTVEADSAAGGEGDTSFLDALEANKVKFSSTAGDDVDPDELLALFRQYQPSQKNRFQWLVYQSLLKRMDIVKGLRTLKMLEAGNKTVRARAQMRRVDAMALELFRMVREMEKADLKNNRLKVLRARWVSQCRELMEFVKAKNGRYSRR